jgi:hypothetical protein
MFTYTKPFRDKPEVFFVESWYDRSTRCWATQLKDGNLDQIGAAVWTACKESAAKVHREFLDSLTDGMPYVVERIRK